MISGLMMSRVLSIGALVKKGTMSKLIKTSLSSREVREFEEVGNDIGFDDVQGLVHRDISKKGNEVEADKNIFVVKSGQRVLPIGTLVKRRSKLSKTSLSSRRISLILIRKWAKFKMFPVLPPMRSFRIDFKTHKNVSIS